MPPECSMEKGKEYDNTIGCAIVVSSAPHIVGATTLLYPDDLLFSYVSCTVYGFLILLFST